MLKFRAVSVILLVIVVWLVVSHSSARGKGLLVMGLTIAAILGVFLVLALMIPDRAQEFGMRSVTPACFGGIFTGIYHVLSHNKKTDPVSPGKDS